MQLEMAFHSPTGSLDGYQFTFETYLDDSSRIEPDPCPSSDIVDSQSLTDSIAGSHIENGRTYHAYRAGSYYYPNDPTENERLDEQYEILKFVLGGRNYLAPLSRHNPPKRVLDIATGTGTWAIDMGDEFPEAQIVGSDLSPSQPEYVPPNVRFFVEDMTDDWEYPRDHFDFIHTRITLGCWSDMKRQVLQRAFDHLRPGGWMECQEVYARPVCDDGTMADDHAFLRWADETAEASRVADRQMYIGEELGEWMAQVGFVDVQQLVFKIPLNGWPRDRLLKQMGLMWQRNLLNGLSGFSLALLTRIKGRTVEDIEVSLVDVRKDLFDKSKHAYHKFYVVWGRKPDVGEQPMGVC